MHSGNVRQCVLSAPSLTCLTLYIFNEITLTTPTALFHVDNSNEIYAIESDTYCQGSDSVKSLDKNKVQKLTSLNTRLRAARNFHYLVYTFHIL